MGNTSFQTYLVGGAVRDQLLGLPIIDRDWVVVGATPEQLLAQGFQQVGADFPVFLHPETHEEYALARTERKTGPGYQGFICDFSPDVTLEADLERRDLTINAMAMTPTGEVVDPFGGQQDLVNRRLRHVSPAFREDPLRVIRVARFAARFEPDGFTIAAETLSLMRAMSDSGELSSLTPQRVWQEMEKVLADKHPSTFFLTLRSTGALKHILPEIDALFGVPQTMQYHPEVDTGIHVMQALDRATGLTSRLDVRFAVLCHDLGKPLTPQQYLPGHRGHEKRGLKVIAALCQRLRVSKRLERLALLTSEWHTHLHQLQVLKASTILKLLSAFRAFQDDTQLRGFALACQADAQGRSGHESSPYPQARGLLLCCEAAAAVTTRPLLERGLKGPELGAALNRERIRAIDEAMKTWRAELHANHQ